jgi:hypothetical protein
VEYELLSLGVVAVVTIVVVVVVVVEAGASKMDVSECRSV